MLPQGPDRRTWARLACAFLLLSTIVAHAQVFDFDRDRVPMAELNGLMRFHTGDDSRWSDPGFDDSQWPLIRSDRDWSQQGYKNYSGTAWYRFRVVLPREHRPFGIYFGSLLTSYQVFADGRLIGQVGHLPPNEEPFRSANDLFLLPDTPARDNLVVIAIRVWQWPRWAMYYGGGLGELPRIGDADTLRDWRSKELKVLDWALSASSYQGLIDFLAGIGGISLFALRRKEREYLWFGLTELISSATDIAQNYRSFYSLPVESGDLLLNVLGAAGSIAFITFLVYMLKRTRRALYWTAVASSVFGLLLTVPFHAQWISMSSWIGISELFNFVFEVCVLLVLILGLSRGEEDARLLVIPIGFSFLQGSLHQIGWALVTAGFGSVQRALDWWDDLVHWPVPLSGSDIANVLVDLTLFAILVLRFARSRREEERFKAELESARTVQQVLIPDEIPEIPGLALECVYRPAGQVGGDFFQIISVRDDAALIVIGDVSGKGMPAAMTVSLLVGTVRTLAHYTQSPAEILSAMNQRLLARSKDGFTTCMVLRVDSDGRVSAANAGHLPPYVDGREVAMANGLPLGLVAGAEYAQTSFMLNAGGQLTLMTDGVAEARARNGELFGFERAASIAILNAEHIASTARVFGQQDDVTVLTVRRIPEPVAHPLAVMGVAPTEA